MEEIEEQIIYYYDVIMISNNVEPKHKYLTYSSTKNIPDFTYVDVKLKNKKAKGIIYRKRPVELVEISLEKVKAIDCVNKKLEENLEENLDEDLDKDKDCKKLFLPPAYFHTVVFMKQYYFLPFSQIFRFVKPHRKITKNIQLNLDNLNLNIELSDQQQIAYEQIINAKNTVLLFGETGSGKTRIYKKLIADVLLDNGDVIFLVPEINLVPQTVGRLKKHFNDLVAPWHSKVSKNTKVKTINEIEQGLIKIVVGTITSIFLPFNNVKLIIIDEEHSESYFLGREEKTFFSGRDMGIYLGEKLKAKVILGSATPLINSYHKFDIVKLKREQSLNSGNNFLFFDDKKLFVDTAINKIREKLANGEKALWFVPVKGNFKYSICVSCHEKIECQNCSTGMRVYSDDQKLQCNRCGYHEPVPKVCPKCGGEIKVKNIGTIETTKILKKQFPDKNIVYIDGDVTKKKGTLEKTLDDFANNKIDILVGTQIMSKGHDFPDLNFVIVSDIDISVDFMDFQAYERGLRNLVQIIGRSGRREKGEVIIQTKHSEFFKIFINNYEDFLSYEMENRKGLFPPFVKFGRILIESKTKEAGINILKELENIILNNLKYEIFISGETDIKKLNSKYRFNIILKNESTNKLSKLWEEILLLSREEFRKNISFAINPNSYN